eukprot:1138693-Pelagomonas_calceolata.AAC.2
MEALRVNAPVLCMHTDVTQCATTDSVSRVVVAAHLLHCLSDRCHPSCTTVAASADYARDVRQVAGQPVAAVAAAAAAAAGDGNAQGVSAQGPQELRSTCCLRVHCPYFLLRTL